MNVRDGPASKWHAINIYQNVSSVSQNGMLLIA
jgi:hypothetical protein